MNRLSIQGRPLAAKRIGALPETDDIDDIRTRFERHGYLLIRRAIDPDAVAVAYDFICEQLVAVEEVALLRAQAVATGTSRRRELHPDLGRFWQSLSESVQLRQCVQASALYEVFNVLFDEPVRPFDFVWLRAFTRGQASPLHIDHPYMNRGTHRVVSCWIPLADVAIENGALFVVEDSNRLQSLRREFEGHDVDLNGDKPGYIDTHPIDFARRHGLRILSSDFVAGDVLIFDHFTAHASFDNCDPTGRVRLSCDTRWQPVSQPMDERFEGPDPRAHGGLGYGCLRAAQPLTDTPELR